MDWVEYCRRMAREIEVDATPSQVGPTSVELRALANEIMRLRTALSQVARLKLSADDKTKHTTLASAIELAKRAAEPEGTGR